MAVNLSPYGGVGAQFFDNSGNVLTGGKIETYAAGTTTPQATYTSSSGLTFHPNPIILDASGRVPSGGEIWLTDGFSYKFVLKDSNNVLIATYDNIIGINSNFVNFTNQQEIQTATAGQTVFNLATTTYQPGTNSLSVFVDGVNQYGPGAQYAYLETDSDTVTFINGLHVGALVKFTTSQLNSSGATTASQVSFTGFKGQTGSVQDLADDDGSDWVGFVADSVNAVAISAQDKMRQTVSVKDFGAVGDGVTNDTAEIQAALNFAFTNGGGRVYAPAGTYIINSPLIVRSNVIFEGDGASTIIKNTFTGGKPQANCIHVGYGYEWNQNGQSFNAGSNDDATIAQLLANNFTKLTTVNAGVRNLQVQTVLSSSGTSFYGLGVWTMNALNSFVENIWAASTLTPVSIANDAAGWQAGCANISVRNVFQISSPATNSWYDLMFVGSALNTQISGLYNNPNTPASLIAMVALNGAHDFTITDSVLNTATVPAPGKYGISVNGGSAGAIVSNVFRRLTYGVNLGGGGVPTDGMTVSNNIFDTCQAGLVAQGGNPSGAGIVADPNQYISCPTTYFFTNDGGNSVLFSPNNSFASSFSRALGSNASVQGDYIDTLGSWYLGTTSPPYPSFPGKATVIYSGAGPGPNLGLLLVDTDPTNTTRFAEIFYRNGVQVGNIATSLSGVTYNTASDYRLKNNQAPLTDSGSFIDSLQPKAWTWENTGEKGVGFIAHEVQAVSPTSVMGKKDAVDEEGKPVYQSMEYGSSEFVANIVAELQSLRKRVADLESK
jgi:hypothetical protein